MEQSQRWKPFLSEGKSLKSFCNLPHLQEHHCLKTIKLLVKAACFNSDYNIIDHLSEHTNHQIGHSRYKFLKTKQNWQCILQDTDHTRMLVGSNCRAIKISCQIEEVKKPQIFVSRCLFPRFWIWDWGTNIY